MRIAEYFDAAAAENPQNLAFIDGNRNIDFAHAQELVHAAAHALSRESGLGKGAHVAIYSPNDYRVTLLHFAINRADMAWVSVHVLNSVQVNSEVLSFMDCDFIFFHSDFEHVVPQLKAEIPQVKRFVCIDRFSEHGICLEAWLEGCWTRFPIEPENSLQTAFLQPTGGTTGPSKGVVHTCRSMEMAYVAANFAHQYDSGTRYLAVAPLTHAGGFLAMTVAARGGTVIVLPGFEPEAVLSSIQEHGITNLFLPPTALYALLSHPLVERTDRSSLRAFTTGAAPVAPDKFKEAVRVFGPVMCEGYGQTEGYMPITTKKPEDYLRDDGGFDEAVLRSAGRVSPVYRVEIMDEHGNLLPRGEQGEIVVRSSAVMREYYKNPEGTREAWTHGWLHTGDIGIKDPRGFVTIVDRKKDMIITGGFNVYPAQVESAINSHPAVQDCAVVGVADEKWGEAVTAVVQLKPAEDVGVDELKALCRERLGPVYTPKVIEFSDELPRSAVGKLLRREVRSMLEQARVSSQVEEE